MGGDSSANTIHIWTSLVNLGSQFKIKFIISIVLAYISHLIGYDWVTIEVLVYLVTIDWILGSAVAVKRKRFSSWKMKRTLYKALLYFVLLIAIHQAKRIEFFPQWGDGVVEMMICLTELKSILENSAILGFKYAHKIEVKLNSFLEEKLK